MWGPTGAGVPGQLSLPHFAAPLVLFGFPGGSEVQPPGQEDPLKEERATYPVFLPGKVHGHRSLGGYSPWGCERVGLD